MADTLTFDDRALAAAQPATRARVPWPLWCAAAAVTSATIGTQWDISWHRSIGRDTFWTPAHIAIYLCGVLAGGSSLWLILAATFGRGQAGARAAAVRLWGLYGPLGAFIGAWGAAAMLVSAPFDNWWHDAYGLDVKILSPPHSVLIAGLFGVQLGALILIRSAANRARGVAGARLDVLFLYLAGLILIGKIVLVFEHIARIEMHTAAFYRTIAIVVPGLLALMSRAAGHRWTCTIASAIYTAGFLAQLWILPLFPAEPKLGPVYLQVNHFVPWEFPLLLIVPAFLIDLVWQRMKNARRVTLAAVAGPLFVASFAAVQWPFATFLMSPAARNRFFGAIYFGYFTRPTSLYFRHQFLPTEPAADFWRIMAVACLIAIGTMWCGLVFGDWLRRLKR